MSFEDVRAYEQDIQDQTNKKVMGSEENVTVS